MAAEYTAAGYCGAGIIPGNRRLGFELRPAGHSQLRRSAGKEQSQLTGALEKCIRSFEPRISHPRVFLTRTDPLSRSLRFHIEGQITYENMDEEIKFDTILELTRGEYEVK